MQKTLDSDPSLITSRNQCLPFPKLSSIGKSGCEGDLTATAVTPLVARVNSADQNQGWLCRSLLPPSQQHVHPSWSCIFKEAYRQVFGEGPKSSCSSQIDQTSSQGPYANQLISTLPDYQLKHLTLIQSPLSFASEIYFLPFFVGLNILIPLLSFNGTLKEKENRLLLNLFSLTRPIILVKHLNSKGRKSKHALAWQSNKIKMTGSVLTLGSEQHWHVYSRSIGIC